MTQDKAKKLVGERAAELVEPEMIVGLGTGSTAAEFIRALCVRNSETPLNLCCVASSVKSEAMARNGGLKVIDPDDVSELDLYIDGADEVGPRLSLIKGGGAAQYKEKATAKLAKKFIVVVDKTKLVPQLGDFPLPLEVVKFSLKQVMRELTELRLDPKIRLLPNGQRVRTDLQNFIVDCHDYVHKRPQDLASLLDHMTGVLEHGIFLRMASLALVATDNGVVELDRMSDKDWAKICTKYG